MNRLEKLVVESNNLEELPEDLVHCQSLLEIWLNNNQIKTIPPELKKLPCLKIYGVNNI